MGKRRIWAARREKKGSERKARASGWRPSRKRMLEQRGRGKTHWGKVGPSRDKAARANGGKQEQGKSME